MRSLTAIFSEKVHQYVENRLDMKKPRIYLDIDGTLGNFMGHAENEGKLTADGKIMFDKLDYKWWVTMPEYDGAKAFYDEAHRLGDTYFLTGPSLDSSSYEGKADWTKIFVPERANAIPGESVLEELIICRSKEKYFLSERGRILVDDNADNIKAWQSKGGIGILHTGSYVETLKQLKKAVKKITRPSPAEILMKGICRLPKLH
jgi:hypothetical protein